MAHQHQVFSAKQDTALQHREFAQSHQINWWLFFLCSQHVIDRQQSLKKHSKPFPDFLS
jgi:hypothetical protein